MTRRSIITVLGSLLVGLLVIVQAAAVSADDWSGGSSTPVAAAPVHILGGNGIGQEQFETLTPSNNGMLFSTAPVHLLSGNGMGQEQFEATEGSEYGIFVIAVPTNVAVHVESGYAPENYERMMPPALIPSN